MKVEQGIVVAVEDGKLGFGRASRPMRKIVARRQARDGEVRGVLADDGNWTPVMICPVGALAGLALHDLCDKWRRHGSE